MIKNIFIGVDGGGTKTRILIEDEREQELAVAVSGPGNIRESASRAWISINEGIHSALQKAGLSLGDPSYHFHLGLGLAGTEIKGASASFMRVPHNQYTSVVLDTDALAACLGVHGGKSGSVIIIGTGVVGFSIQDGQRQKVGGWGFPHADEGGGAWLGMELTRLTLKMVDGRIQSSPLLDAVFDHFNRNSDEFVTWAARATPGDFGTLAPMIISFKNEGDSHAEKLLISAAKEIQLVAEALSRDNAGLGKESLPLGLIGGISPFVKPYLTQSIRDQLVTSQFCAAKGAVIMIKHHLNGHQE